MKISLPRSYNNMISYVGSAIAIVFVFMFSFLYITASVGDAEKAYTGVVIFIIIPLFIIIGLTLIPIGMIYKIRQLKKYEQDELPDFPIVNLNLREHRNATIIFIVGTLVFFFLSALGSYQAYQSTESNVFCGTLCHEVMIAEYTAYQTSPHARVKCAECHIGAGANWYVKSKLSGVRQVYAAITDSYDRPIETPIKNLRPARETCEECHWPQKVYGKNQRREIYVLPDEENTRWEIDLLMNTGGGNPALGQSSGIHWHINQDIEIDYITTDDKRMTIPKVILRNKVTGDSTVFENEEEPLEVGNADYVERRTMDCIDCHNRPSHKYLDPNKFLNIAIASGEVPASLPMIKQVAIEAVVVEYASTQEAMDGIADYVATYYQENYPDQVKSEDLEKAIAGIQKAFASNIFPEMNIRWEYYPEHVGHQTAPGCFRCHDGKHVSEQGVPISDQCNVCHFITAQGPANEMEIATSKEGLEFKHPVDIGEEWKETACYECHSVPPI